MSHIENRPPAELLNLTDRLHSKLQHGCCDQRITAGCLEFDYLPVNRCIRKLVARFLDRCGICVTQHIACASCVVTTEIIVLIKDADFCIWILPENVSGVKTGSHSVAGAHTAHRVGCTAVIAPAVSAAVDEQLRNFSLIEICGDGELSGRPN